MLKFINYFNAGLFLLVCVLYFYQIVYAIVVLLAKKGNISQRDVCLHKYAVLIAARNESRVVGKLVKSIKKQTYPSFLVDIYVVADNCTDDTAKIAARAGATVYTRYNKVRVGKGYALDYLFKRILYKHADTYDGYFVFDADNLLDPHYIAEMNKMFDKGYRILTSYRNSKNYDSNWISAGYALWFLRESKYLNNARMLMGNSCAISGTGFLVHKDIIKKNNGWKHHLLTEDIEFSVDSVIHGEKIGYCGTAKLYDEQPYRWSQSWKQRLRWSKGFLQVFRNYAGGLMKGILRRDSFSYYDMFMTITPAVFVSLIGVLVNLFFLFSGIVDPAVTALVIPVAARAVLAGMLNSYMVLYAFGLLTTITEWKEICCRPCKKILYTFTFPLFILTNVPITLTALFKKIEWVPIAHTISKSIEEVHFS